MFEYMRVCFCPPRRKLLIFVSFYLIPLVSGENKILEALMPHRLNPNPH